MLMDNHSTPLVTKSLSIVNMKFLLTEFILCMPDCIVSVQLEHLVLVRMLLLMMIILDLVRLVHVVLADRDLRFGPVEFLVIFLIEVRFRRLGEVVLRRRVDKVARTKWPRVSGSPSEVDVER